MQSTRFRKLIPILAFGLIETMLTVHHGPASPLIISNKTKLRIFLLKIHLVICEVNYIILQTLFYSTFKLKTLKRGKLPAVP